MIGWSNCTCASTLRQLQLMKYTLENSYKILDCIKDVGEAWDKLDTDMIHKCFEPVLDIDSYLKQYNEQNNSTLDWPDTNGGEFIEMTPEQSVINMKIDVINDLVKKLNDLTLPGMEVSKSDMENDFNYDVTECNGYD